jgi:hypothetical protein
MIIYKIFKNIVNFDILICQFGDWGLGIGDWAQSPIPNPQSPIPNPLVFVIILFFNYIFYK